MAGLQEQQGIGSKKGGGHCDLAAVGKAEFLVNLELLNAGKNVIPTPCI